MCYLRQRLSPKIIFKHFDSFSVPFGSLDTTAWSFKSVPPHSDPIKHCRKIDGGTNKESCGKTSWQVFSPIALPTLCSSLCVFVISAFMNMRWCERLCKLQLRCGSLCAPVCACLRMPSCVWGLGPHYMHDAICKQYVSVGVCAYMCLLVCFCKTDQSRCVGVVLKKAPLQDKRPESKRKKDRGLLSQREKKKEEKEVRSGGGGKSKRKTIKGQKNEGRW